MDQHRAALMLDEARAELATARTSVRYLEQVVAGLEGLLHTAPPAQEGTSSTSSDSAHDDRGHDVYPKSTDAIERVLQARPNFYMKFPQIWASLVDANLVDPSVKSGRNAYQNSARRLADDARSAVDRDHEGRYAWRTDHPAAAPKGASHPDASESSHQLTVQTKGFALAQ